MEAAATLGSRGAETPSLPLSTGHCSHWQQRSRDPQPAPLATGHCSQALRHSLNSSFACPSGMHCWRGHSEGSRGTLSCAQARCLSAPLGASPALGAKASCAVQHRSVPVLSLAWLGVLGQGLPKAGRQPGHCALMAGGRGFHQQKWCLRHRFLGHPGAGVWLSGTHRCPEPLRHSRSVQDSEAGVHEDKGQACGCCGPGGQPWLRRASALGWQQVSRGGL